ncbi:MAG TPA: hypothetical protein VJR29_11945 [bacterium]|nr:hypothetical protein [bacterium]
MPNKVLDVILWLVLFAVVVGLLVWLRIRENRYLKKKTKDAVRPQIRLEIEAEKEDTLRRKKAFQDRLDKWKQ